MTYVERTYHQISVALLAHLVIVVVLAVMSAPMALIYGKSPQVLIPLTAAVLYLFLTSRDVDAYYRMCLMKEPFFVQHLKLLADLESSTFIHMVHKHVR